MAVTDNARSVSSRMPTAIEEPDGPDGWPGKETPNSFVLWIEGRADGVDLDRNQRVLWIATRILPHEADVRAWTLRHAGRRHDVDDLIQEAYARLWGVADLASIANPRAYFFQTVRRILIDHVRRASVVDITALPNLDGLQVEEACSSPERIVAGRLNLKRVRELIERLPDRCCQIVTMRKIQGLSQREIAQALGVTESIVENELGRGLHSVLAAYESGDADDVVRTLNWKARNRVRR